MQPQRTQAQTIQSQEILKLLFDALIAKQTPNVPAATTEGAATVNTSQLLQAIVAGLSGKQLPTPIVGSPASPSGTVPPVLSPIDNWLGGEALAGKKTALSIFAYAGLAIFQALGVAGTATGTTATPTGQILTTLIAAFGGLGGIAKIDRVVQMLGLIAARPPASS